MLPRGGAGPGPPPRPPPRRLPTPPPAYPPPLHAGPGGGGGSAFPVPPPPTGYHTPPFTPAFPPPYPPPPINYTRGRLLPTPPPLPAWALQALQQQQQHQLQLLQQHRRAPPPQSQPPPLPPPPPPRHHVTVVPGVGGAGVSMRVSLSPNLRPPLPLPSTHPSSMRSTHFPAAVNSQPIGSTGHSPATALNHSHGTYNANSTLNTHSSLNDHGGLNSHRSLSDHGALNTHTTLNAHGTINSNMHNSTNAHNSAANAHAHAPPTANSTSTPAVTAVRAGGRPLRPQHLSQVLAALAVSLGPFAAGLGKGYSSPAIASLQEQQAAAEELGARFPSGRLPAGLNASASGGGGVLAGVLGGGGAGGAAGVTFSVSEQQASWVASLSLLGALFGGLLGGVAMRSLGRRKVLLLAAPPFSASWLATVFASSVEMMFGTAFVGGFCCAIVLLVTQVYISEIAGPEVRGCLSAVLKVVGHVGTLTSFAVGAFLDWRQLAMVVAAAPVALFAAVLYVPETPSFLVLSGRDAEAAAALRWLRGPAADVGRELATLRSNVQMQQRRRLERQGLGVTRAAWAALLSPALVRPALVTCGLMLFQRFSGAHAFNFYAVPIFRQTFGGMDPHGGAVAVAFVQLLAALLSGLLIDTAGRLPLLVASSMFMSMALAGFGSFAYYEHAHRRHMHHRHAFAPVTSSLGPQHDWVPLLCVLVFTVAFSLGISPISWLLIGELFPLECRELGGALATCFSYVCAFIGVKTFVDFRQALGLHGAFWLYSVVSLVGLCFVVVCVPETKGRDLDELHPKLAGGSTRSAQQQQQQQQPPPPPPIAAQPVGGGWRMPGCGAGCGASGFCGSGAAPGIERCA